MPNDPQDLGSANLSSSFSSRYSSSDRFLKVASRAYTATSGEWRSKIVQRMTGNINPATGTAMTRTERDNWIKYGETVYSRQYNVLMQTFAITNGYVTIGYRINSQKSAYSPRANDVLNYGAVARASIGSMIDTMGFIANVSRWQSAVPLPDGAPTLARSRFAPMASELATDPQVVLASESARLAANRTAQYQTNLKIKRTSVDTVAGFGLAANAVLGIGMAAYTLELANASGRQKAFNVAAIQMGAMLGSVGANLSVGIASHYDVTAMRESQKALDAMKFTDMLAATDAAATAESSAKKFYQAGRALGLIQSVLSITQLIPVLTSSQTSEQKGVIAAEMLAQLSGGYVQSAANYRLAINLAAGLTDAEAMAGPALGAVASALMLSMSPIEIYGLTQKTKYRNALADIGTDSVIAGYAGDTALSQLWTERIGMETNTLTDTTILAVVGAAVEVVALLGGPVSLATAAVVTLVAAAAGAILKAVQQPRLEAIARKYIKSIQSQGGAQAYFNRNLQAQYHDLIGSAATRSNLAALQSDFQVGQVIAVSTVKLSKTALEFAATTRNAARIKTADIYIDSFVNGAVKPNNSLTITNKLTTGLIDITGSASGSSQLLTFLTPLMAPGVEQRVRTKTGANTFKTSVDILYTGNGWTISDAGVNTTMDLRMMAAHLYDSKNKLVRNVPVIVHTGAGDDTVLMGSADTTVGSTVTTLDPSDPSFRPDAGFDTVSYQGLATGTSIALKVNADGSITVNKTVAGASVYNEVDSYEAQHYGTRVENVAVRDVVVSKVDNIKATDTLYHVARVIGSVGNDTMTGGAGNDFFMGGAGDDLLAGGDGDDVLAGGNGVDTLTGGAGVDTADYRDTDSGVGLGIYVHLSSQAFDNANQPVMVAPKSTAVWSDLSQLVKAPVSDANMAKFAGHAVVADMWDPTHPNQFYGYIDQLSSIENIWGSNYADRIEGDEQANYLWGADGNDLIRGGDGDDAQNGGSGDDMMFGQDGDDVLDGGSGNDALSGDNGNDVLIGSEGADTLDGGDGVDTADYSTPERNYHGVTVNLTTGLASDWSGDTDVLRNIENVVGTYGSDTLTGDAGKNRLDAGLSGYDILQGMDGDDTLMGGRSGELYGQSWGTGRANDWVAVSDNGNDTADFSNNSYGAYGIVGVLDSGASRWDVIDPATGKLRAVGVVQQRRVPGMPSIEVDNGYSLLYQIENLAGTSYDDELTGDAAANILQGGGGNDTISGGDGDDVIDGGAGDNSMSGGAGDDYFVFGADVDTGGMRIDNIDGGSGFNTLDFSELSGKWASGIDLDLSTSGTNAVPANSKQFIVRLTVAGTSSIRIAATVANIQNVVGSTFNDRMVGDGADNLLIGMAGNDYLSGAGGDDLLAGGEGDDTLDGGVGADALWGGTGNDSLLGGAGDDVFKGGAGNDILNGGLGFDTADYSDNPDGATGIWASLNPNAAGAILVYEHWDATTQAQNSGAVDQLISIDNIIGTDYDDKIEGDKAANRLDGGLGDDWISGGDGPDTLIGGAGDDTLVSGDGVDSLVGGDGNDLFMQTVAAGSDTIDGGAGINSLDYSGTAINTAAGALGADVRYGISANLASGTVIKLSRGADQPGIGTDKVNNIAAIKGSNLGDHLVGDQNANVFAGYGGNDLIDGANGNDYLSGDGGDDTLQGGAGDDTLFGGAGTDSISGGDGHDNIAQDLEAVNDSIDGGSGIDILDYSLTDFGSDVRPDMGHIGIYADLEGGTVDKYHSLSTGPKGVDRISHIEGLIGTQFDDNIQGGAGGEVFSGMGGRDTINGGAGNDVLFGGGGADLLNGGDGDDTIMQDIEAVNDTIDGGAGVDTLDYTLTEFPDPDAAGMSISVDMTAGATLKSSANGVVSKDAFANIENVNGSSLGDRLCGNEFGNVLNGTAGNDTIYGMAGNDTLDGGIDDDLLFGGSGSDLIRGGDGDDTIMQDIDLVSDTIDGGDGEDTVDYSLTQFISTTFVHNAAIGIQAELNTGIVVKYANTSAASIVDKLSNIEDLNGSRFNDLITGDANSNVLNGGLGSDTVRAGAGDDIVVQTVAREKDTLDGGDGTDMLDYSTSIFAAGSRTAAGGRGIIADLTLGRVDKYEAKSTDAFDMVSNFENVFGTTLADSITGSADANWLAGREGNDTLVGLAGNDFLDGGDGDDSLQGGAGDDLLAGGHGNDVLEGGGGSDTFRFSLSDGVDLIRETATAATERDGLSFGPEIGIAQLWFKRVKDNLEISLLGTADKVTIESWYKGAAYQLEAIQTQVGMVLAPAQVDVLVAAMAKVSNPNALATMPAAVTTAISSAWQLDSATRYVMGGDLDDTIGGGNGADTIDGGAGDDDLSGNGGDDFFVEDVNDDLDRIDGGAGNNTVSYERTLLVGAGISADLDGGRVDKLPADGTLPASYDTLTNVDNIIGSWGDDELSGNTRANCMDGKAGDDALSGYGGNDSLSGGDGNDYIDGGAGNDVLNGGAGADLYVFNAGDGADVVTDNDAIADTIDTIYFGSGITVDKLWFQHVGNDLQVSVIGTGDSVKVTDWYSGAAHQIEMFSVNNSNLLGSDVEKMVNAMAGLNAPGMGQLTLPATYETRLGATRAANWHAAA